MEKKEAASSPGEFRRAQEPRPSSPARKSAPVLLVAGILCIAANLRAPLTSVGPVVGLIRDGLQLSGALAGMVTTLPLFAFALFSPFVPRLARRIGTEAVLFWAAVLLTLGILLRSQFGVVGLFSGTAALGLAISAGNVLVPSLIKKGFPRQIGVMTGVYSVSMNLFAALASGVSVPLASGLELGWAGSLRIWALLGMASLLLWIPQVRRRARGLPGAAGGAPGGASPGGASLAGSGASSGSASSASRAGAAGASNAPRGAALWRSPLAWQVTLYMGLQSMVFYCMIAWLPAILAQGGLEAGKAGWMLSFMQITIIPTTFVVSVLAGRRSSQRSLVLVGSACAIVGLGGLLFARESGLVLLWIAVLGVGGGFTFVLAMLFFSLRTRTADEAARLSGMAQSFGYLLAAFGPILFGLLHDAAQNWDLPLAALTAMALVCLVAGLGASRDLCVSPAPPSQKERRPHEAGGDGQGDVRS